MDNDPIVLIEFPDGGRIYMEADSADDAWNKFEERYPGAFTREQLVFTNMLRSDVPEGVEIQ